MHLEGLPLKFQHENKHQSVSCIGFMREDGLLLGRIDQAWLCVYRVGPPRFLGGILIVWGIVASLFAWMRTAMHFYVLRFILGLAESGAYPGAPVCAF